MTNARLSGAGGRGAAAGAAVWRPTWTTRAPGGARSGDRPGSGPTPPPQPPVVAGDPRRRRPVEEVAGELQPAGGAAPGGRLQGQAEVELGRPRAQVERGHAQARQPGQDRRAGGARELDLEQRVVAERAV